MASRAITSNYQSPHNLSIVSSITSLLQSLNPQNPNPKSSKLNPSFLDHFSSHLNPSLVIQVIKNQVNPYHALFFFNWASNPIPNPNKYSHSLHCYLAITDVLLANSLFSTASSLLRKSNRLSDFMIGKFIKAYGDRRDLRGAINWFHEAKSIENGKCVFSYNAILGVLVKSNRVVLAKAIYDQIRKEGVVEPNVSTYTTMIRGFCKMGMIESAYKVFDEMSCTPNLVTFNTMIHGFCKKGDLEMAQRIFDQMVESGYCLPDVVTYTTLINGYSKNGEFDEAIECVNEMVKRGCEPVVMTYNALIDGLCLHGNVDEAKRMMTKMRFNGLKDDVVTRTSILKGLCIVGRPDEAVKHIKEMVSLGMKPDVISYGVVVNEYCKMGKAEEAISLLKEMRARGIIPSVSSFNAVLRILVDRRELDRAILLLKQMSQMGCTPNFVSYDTVICTLYSIRGRMQEVEELFGDMIRGGHKPDATIYSCLVKGYCEDENVEMAMQVLWEANGKNYVINLESFSIFVKELCVKGKVTEVEKFFEEMCRKNRIIDLDGYRRVLDGHLCMYSRNNITT